MKANGMITICTGKEFILGVMEGNMKVSMLVIRNMVTESITGLMDADMKACGRMGNKMVKASTFYPMVSLK